MSPSPPHLTTSVIQTLVLYALGEQQLGHATTIRVTAQGQHFSVEDDGRGHAVHRTVAGAPYLDLIYTHLDHPFGLAEGPPVQLQGLGMSLLNRLCSELQVCVRKPDATLNLVYAHGRLVDHALTEQHNTQRGNRIWGCVDPRLAPEPVDEAALATWLARLQAASRGLQLVFNGNTLAPTTWTP